MFCQQCGKKVDDSVNHCPECGANLKEAGRSAAKEIIREIRTEPSNQVQTTVVRGGGGFFSGLFQGVGGILGCCIGAIIIVLIIIAIARG